MGFKFFNNFLNTSFDDWISGAAGANASAAASKGLSEWSAKNLPSLQREGYVKAGYNPLLITGNSPSSYMANVGAHQASDMNGFGSAFGGMVSMAKALANFYNDIKASKLENEKTQSEIKNIEADTRSKNIGTVTKGVGAAAAGVGAGVGVYNAIKHIKHKPIMGFSSAPGSSAPVGASSASGSAFTSARMLGGITAAGLAYPMAMYGLGKYLESRGYEPPKGNDSERNHRMSGLNTRKVGDWKPDSKRNIRNKFKHK